MVEFQIPPFYVIVNNDINELFFDDIFKDLEFRINEISNNKYYIEFNKEILINKNHKLYTIIQYIYIHNKKYRFNENITIIKDSEYINKTLINKYKKLKTMSLHRLELLFYKSALFFDLIDEFLSDLSKTDLILSIIISKRAHV